MVSPALQNGVPKDLNENFDHKEETPQSFQCNFCSKDFTSIGNLGDHIRHIHEKTRFPCTLCNKSFVKAQFLNDHIVENHSSPPMKFFPSVIPLNIKPDLFSILAALKPIPTIPVRTDVLPANMVSIN
jgi:uncharacterized Zn-finger protein